MSTKNLFQVVQGEAHDLSEVEAFDAENSVNVLADDEADALRIARRYDLGELQVDNRVWNGVTIPAVAETERDRA